MNILLNFLRADVTPEDILKKRGLSGDMRARKYLASQVARHCDPYVPMAQGTLKNSPQIAEDGSAITYPGPYANYQHTGLAMGGRAPKHYTGASLTYHGGPMRGSEWDKRMLADHAGDLEQDLAAYVGGKPE